MEVDRQISEDSASLRALIDTIVDGVVIIDNGGAIRVFNPASERLFGYRADEIIGQNVSILMPEPFRSEHDGYLAAYHRTGQKRIIGIGREVVGRRKDGSTFPMELSVGETKLGTGNAYVGVIRDISDRKRSEEELRAARDEALAGSKAKSVLLMELNHRVRNNLMLILSVMRLQRRRITDPVAGEIMESLRRRVESVGLVQNLMFEAEAFGTVDREMMRKITDAVCGTFDASQAVISVDIADDISLPSSGAMPLTMIFTELLLNAFKHAFGKDQADAAIRVALQKEGNYAVLTVRDNGKGIDQKNIQEGSMGYWLVQLLTQQIAGTVDYKVDRGTLVTVRFPVVIHQQD